jgi:hypothetical protein
MPNRIPTVREQAREVRIEIDRFQKADLAPELRKLLIELKRDAQVIVRAPSAYRTEKKRGGGHRPRSVASNRASKARKLARKSSAKKVAGKGAKKAVGSEATLKPADSRAAQGRFRRRSERIAEQARSLAKNMPKYASPVFRCIGDYDLCVGQRGHLSTTCALAYVLCMLKEAKLFLKEVSNFTTAASPAFEHPSESESE